MKNNSINKNTRYLKSVLRFFEDYYCEEVIKSEMEEEDGLGFRFTTISNSEMSRIQKNINARDPEAGKVIDFLWFTGMRVRSALLMQKKWINHSANPFSIKIPAGINKGKKYTYKIGIREEIIPFIDQRLDPASKAVDDVLEICRGFNINLVNKRDLNQLRTFGPSLLFPGTAIYGIDSYIAHVRYLFVSACEESNIHDKRLHDIRRTFATNLIDQNIDLLVVSRLLGHRSAQTTQRYIGKPDVSLEDLFDAVNSNYSQQEIESIQFIY